MARKKTSPAEDFVDVVARLPWWGGVALALASYLILHHFATAPQVTLQSGQMGSFVQRSLVVSFASAGQILLPILCLIAALVSFLRRHRRAGLVSAVTESKGADALNGISWREFELLVGEAFRLQGYTVTELGGMGADGGVDLVLRKGNEKFLVQCKQWKAFKVGVDIVRELYGVMAAQGAAGGFVITSGTFTADAKAFAQDRNVKLVDGPQLLILLQQAKGATTKSSSAAAVHQSGPATRPTANATVPSCPTCEALMVRRTARKGANAGALFWGCSKYPACRGTR